MSSKSFLLHQKEHFQRPTVRYYTGRASKWEVSEAAFPSELWESDEKGGKKDYWSQKRWRTLGEHGPMNQLNDRAHMNAQRLKQQASDYRGLPQVL